MPRVFSLVLLFFTACTFVSEPIAVTREVDVTAVPTLINTLTPTSLPLPTLTAPPPAPTTPTIATVAPATATPTATTTLTAVPTATPAVSLNEFLSTLQNKLNAHDFEAVKDMMISRFVLGEHATRRNIFYPKNAIEFLPYRYVPQVDTNIVINEVNISSELPEPFAVDTIFRGPLGQTITAVVSSSGWGQTGKGEMILYISLQNGQYFWAGLLISPDYYAPPELETIAPPAGLTYKQGNALWRINEASEPQLMTTFSGTLTFNAPGTLALYADTEDNQLTLLHLPDGITETISIKGTLLHGSWQMPWLDDETAVLIVGTPNEDINQGSMGNLAALNVLAGTVTTYSPVLSFYSQPSTGNGDILYDGQVGDMRLWHGGDEQIIDFGHTVTFEGIENQVTALYAPVMSPDGRYMVGVTSGEYGSYNFAYVLADLINHTSTYIHFFYPVPTDAVLPWGIAWSADSQWVALDPPSWIMFENSIQLIPVADPANSIALDGITRKPIWLDVWKLIFQSFDGQQSRWRLVDLRSRKQFWLDLPNGAEVLHYASPN